MKKYLSVSTFLITLSILCCIFTMNVHAEDITINASYSFNQDTVINGNMDVVLGNVDLNGHKIIVEGNVLQENGRIDLKGGSLEINGNLIQSDGIMNIDGGTLQVMKDYRIQSTTDGMTYNFSNGILQMTNDADKVIVNGNFVMQSRASHSGYLSAGTLEIKGNFEQSSVSTQFDSSRYSNYNFIATGTHKVILSGTGMQSVKFSVYSTSYFNILEITNTSEEGVTFETESKVNSEIRIPDDRTKLNNVNNLRFGRNINLNSGDWNYDITIDTSYDYVMLPQDQIIRGNMIIQQEHFGSNCFVINGHKLTVKGNITITGHGALAMENDNDYIEVDGNFYTDSLNSQSLRAGTLEIKGNFEQKSQSTQIDPLRYSNYNFTATGTHKVILSGTGMQSVKFSVYSTSYFNILEITNTSEEGVTFETESKVYSEIRIPDNRTKLNNVNNLRFGRDINLNSGDWNYDITIDTSYDYVMLPQDQIIRGNMIIQQEYFGSNCFVINGHKLTVKGNITITGHGALAMENDNDYIEVDGNFYTDSLNSQSLRAGTLEIKGNFEQKSQSTQIDPLRYSNYNFTATGTHKVILSGTARQTVTFGSSSFSYFDNKGVLIGSNTCSQFNILEAKNRNYQLISLIESPGIVPIYYNTLEGYQPLIVEDGRYTGYSATEQISTMDTESEYAKKSQWAEPIDTATGAHIIEKTLLTVYGAQKLAYSISYNSLLLNEGSLGKGWGSNFDAYLEISGNDITVHWNGNRKNKFKLYDGIYKSADISARYDKLIQNQDGSYKLTLKNQSSYIFNSAGKLVQIKNKKMQPLNLDYDENGRLKQVIEPISGQEISIGYNTEGLVSNITDKSGRNVSLTYDTSHNLTGITDATGYTINYSYNDDGRVLTAIDKNGIILFTDAYDKFGRIQSQDDSIQDNNLTLFNYDEVSQPGKIITTITDRNKNTHIFIHDLDYQLINEIDELGNDTTYTYDGNGNRISKKDAKGNTEYFTYDSNGNISTLKDDKGSLTTMIYDDRNNLLSVEDPKGKKTVYTSDQYNNITSITDKSGNIVTYTHDDESHLISRTSQSNHTTDYSYKDGLLNTITDPSGVITKYEYDAQGRITSQIDALGNITVFNYDNSDNLTEITDPIGNKTSYTYDGYGDILTKTDPKGNITNYTYNKNHKLISRVDSLGNETKYEYDGEDRLTKTIDARGNATVITYDAKGEIAAITNALGNSISMEYDPLGNIISQKDGLNQVISNIIYDSLNNPISITDAMGHNITFEYDKLNKLIKSTDSKGNVSQYSYDDSDKLINVVDDLNNFSSQSFDNDGNRISLIDPNNNQTIFTYDKAGRLLSEKTDDGVEIKYLYDKRGLLEQKTNGRGQITTFLYDDAGRLASFTDPAGTVTMTYDTNGNLLTIGDNQGTSTREYDALNRVVKYTDVWGNSIEYNYDAVGNLTKLIYPGNKDVKYEYDKANRLIKVTDWAGRVTTYDFDANNRLTKTTRPDGSIETKQYDAKGQIISSKDTASDGTLISQYKYKYDEAGNIIEEKNYAEKTVMPASINQTMTYGLGNRLTTYNGQDVGFDNDGNMTEGPLNGKMTNYTYDSRNRLINDGNNSYVYDAQNNRIGIIRDGVSIHYTIDPEAALSQVLVETDGNGTPMSYNVYGLGLIGREAEGGEYYNYHYDIHGNAIALTNIEGVVTDNYCYDSYGNVFIEKSSITNPFMFNGKYGVMNDNNGLYNMRTRYYNPEIKRFINKDILMGNINSSQSINRYIFVEGNPVTNIDPLGMSKDSYYSNSYNYNSIDENITSDSKEEGIDIEIPEWVTSGADAGIQGYYEYAENGAVKAMNAEGEGGISPWDFIDYCKTAIGVGAAYNTLSLHAKEIDAGLDGDVDGLDNLEESYKNQNGFNNGVIDMYGK